MQAVGSHIRLLRAAEWLGLISVALFGFTLPQQRSPDGLSFSTLAVSASTKPLGVCLAALTALLLAVVLAGCSDDVAAGATGNVSGARLQGSPRAGAREIARIGCGGCHTIPGITGADGLVGPPLSQIGRRMFLAGMLRNTPDNMVLWLREPQRIVPGNAMPNMGVTEQQARDMTAYLYTLR